MVLLANILNGLAVVIDMLLSFMLMVVFVYALLSWVNPDPNNPIVRFLRQTSEPMLRPIRRYVPLLGGSVDLSPIVLILLIYFLKAVIGPTLAYYAQMMLPPIGGM